MSITIADGLPKCVCVCVSMSVMLMPSSHVSISSLARCRVLAIPESMFPLRLAICGFNSTRIKFDEAVKPPDLRQCVGLGSLSLVISIVRRVYVFAAPPEAQASAVVTQCGPECTQSHEGQPCLICGRLYEDHSGHTCPRGRGSWPVAGAPSLSTAGALPRYPSVCLCSQVLAPRVKSIELVIWLFSHLITATMGTLQRFALVSYCCLLLFLSRLLALLVFLSSGTARTWAGR